MLYLYLLILNIFFFNYIYIVQNLKEVGVDKFLNDKELQYGCVGFFFFSSISDFWGEFLDYFLFNFFIV